MFEDNRNLLTKVKNIQEYYKLNEQEINSKYNKLKE